VRDTPALWLAWLSSVVDLPQALPWWTRDQLGSFFRDVAIWVAVIGGAVFVMSARWHTRRLRQLTLVWPLPLAVMVASTTVWAARGADGRSVPSAQLELLRAESSTGRCFIIDLERVRLVGEGSLPRRMRVEFARSRAERAGGRNALFELPRVPAGEYRLTPIVNMPRGWLMIGIGRDQFALRTAQIPSPVQPIHIRFPVAVRGLIVRGDEDARQTVRGLLVEPVSLLPSQHFESGPARTAVRYGQSTVFFLDDRSFPEPEAFWVGGARASSFVIQPDDARPSLSMLLRNGPVANKVRLDSSGVRSGLEFGPGEERRLAIPVDRSRRAALVEVTVAGGFRPSEHDGSSRDDRFLGIWVKIE
jgi:hypothetical protein